MSSLCAGVGFQSLFFYTFSGRHESVINLVIIHFYHMKICLGKSEILLTNFQYAKSRMQINTISFTILDSPQNMLGTITSNAIICSTSYPIVPGPYIISHPIPSFRYRISIEKKIYILCVISRVVNMCVKPIHPIPLHPILLLLRYRNVWLTLTETGSNQ